MVTDPVQGMLSWLASMSTFPLCFDDALMHQQLLSALSMSRSWVHQAFKGARMSSLDKLLLTGS